MDKNRRGLCYVMDQEDLTTMRIFYDFRTGEVYLSASKAEMTTLTGHPTTRVSMLKALRLTMPIIRSSM